MSSTDLKTLIERSEVLLSDSEDSLCDPMAEARAVQMCLRHLLRDINELSLDMTARLVAAAIEAVEADLGRLRN